MQSQQNEHMDWNTSSADLAEVENELTGSVVIPARTVVETKQLTDEVKREIHRLLCDRFPVGEKIHMAAISKYLVANEYTPRSYGYSKMKNMLAEMPRFLQLEDVIINQVPNVLITILPDQKTREVPDRAPARSAVRSSSGSVRFAGTDTGSTFKESSAEGQAQTKTRSRSSDPRAYFDRMVYMPPKVVEFLQRKGMSDPGDVLARAYMKSIEDRSFEQRGQTITFPVNWDRSGEGMVAILKKNERSYGRAWYLTYVGFPRMQQDAEEEVEKEEHFEEGMSQPDKALEIFADIGYWQEFLKELADLALPEEWNVSNVRLGRNYLLKKYIQYTFRRLQSEGKVRISEDGRLAAFNTGLYDRHDMDIYACFIPDPEAGDHGRWRFETFTTLNAGSMDGPARQIREAFDPLPEPPSYFEDPSELIFDPKLEVRFEADRLITEQIRRFPLGYLKECCYGDEQSQKLIEDVETARTPERQKQAYQIFGRYLTENDRIRRRLRNRMEDQFETSLKMASRYPRMAVPCYYLREDRCCLLLPLCLERDTVPDAAFLLVSDGESGYHVPALYSMEQAYLFARMLGRAGSDWLRIPARKEP